MRYKTSQGKDGLWQWCAVSGADSVYGGFETKEAAEADAAKMYPPGRVPYYLVLAHHLGVIRLV